MPFLLVEILNFQGSIHHIGVGSFSQVLETEDLISVDRMFVNEYTGSNYTNKLRGALPKVKANMSQGIPQMIE